MHDFVGILLLQLNVQAATRANTCNVGAGNTSLILLKKFFNIVLIHYNMILSLSDFLFR